MGKISEAGGATSGGNGTKPTEAALGKVKVGGAKLVITGSRGGNAALASLLTKLAEAGLITDSTS